MRGPSSRPNILILHTDQHRYEAVGAAGSHFMHTPNLDRLASRGAFLERFYVQSPVCMPSRASMLSGRYPNATTVTTNGIPMPESIRCIQHMLGDAGYFCGIVGKLHFLPHSARDHREPHPSYGFDHLQISDEPGCYRDAYREWVAQRDPSHPDTVNCGLPPARAQWERMMGWTGTMRPPAPRADIAPGLFEAPDDLTNAAFVADRSVQFLRERGAQPFFLFSSFYHPHPPLLPTQSCLDLYDLDEIPLPPGDLKARHRSEDRHLTVDELREIRRAYYAMVTDVDRNIGQILDELEELGHADNTIVVFTSDHGEYLGDHGRFGKGTPGNDCIMRVPCIISRPEQIEAGSRICGLVEATDLVPTLLDYAGVVREPSLQGRSMRPLLDGDMSAARDSVYAEYARPGHCNWVTVRTAEFLYAHNTSGEEVLFDLVADPDELTNIASDSESTQALAEMRRLALGRALDARPSVRPVARY